VVIKSTGLKKLLRHRFDGCSFLLLTTWWGD